MMMMLRNPNSQRLRSSLVRRRARATSANCGLRSPPPTATTSRRVVSSKATSANNTRLTRAISSTSSRHRAAQALVRPPTSRTTTPTTSSSSSSFLGNNNNQLNSRLLWEMLLQNPSTKAALPWIGNGAYLALASGFLMTDMLELRILLVGGYSGLVAFHSLHQRPLKIPLRWSAVFVAVNAVAAGLLVMDRYSPSLNTAEFPDGEELYEKHFQSSGSFLTRGQFQQLLSLAQRQRIPAGTRLTQENVPCHSMYFLIRGQAHVYHGNTNATIEQGGFVNDVAFQRGTNVGAYGTVIADEDCEVVIWDIDALRKHMASRPQMERNMKYCMSNHLVKSLLRQRDANWKRQQQEDESWQ